MFVGHQKIKNYFDRLVEKDNLAHAYLFAGPAGVGKTGFVRYLAARLFCQRKEAAPCGTCPGCRLLEKTLHPDFSVVSVLPDDQGKRNKKRINIEQIRTVQKQINLFPYQADTKIVFIKDAEFLTKEAANALLKTLEEPQGQAVFFLTTSHVQAIFPTIASRCQIIKFGFLGKKEMASFIRSKKPELKDGELKLISFLASGRPGFFEKFLQDQKLKSFLVEQALFFKNIFQKDLGEKFLLAKKLADNQEQARWAVFVWLSLSRLGLLEAERELAKKYFPKITDEKKLARFLRELQNCFQLVQDPSLNQRLLFENLFIKT